MMKGQQKIYWGFRTQRGAIDFCRIRFYLNTLQKPQINLFGGIVRALAGQPWLPSPKPSAPHEKNSLRSASGKNSRLSSHAQFIVLSPTSRKRYLHTTESATATLSSVFGITDIDSSPIDQTISYNTEGLTRVKTTAGMKLYGWVVTETRTARLLPPERVRRGTLDEVQGEVIGAGTCAPLVIVRVVKRINVGWRTRRDFDGVGRSHRLALLPNTSLQISRYFRPFPSEKATAPSHSSPCPTQAQPTRSR